jgi:hypothetical protein
MHMMSLGAGMALWVCALGIAPLMLSASQALRWERDSLNRGQAVLLAQDLAHRLHLNASAASQYQLNWGQQPTSLSCREQPCSRNEWAQSDLAQWRAQLAQILPDGDTWLQTSGGGPNRWLVMAWASDAPPDTTSTARLPVACPEHKRCLGLVLSP